MIPRVLGKYVDFTNPKLHGNVNFSPIANLNSNSKIYSIRSHVTTYKFLVLILIFANPASRLLQNETAVLGLLDRDRPPFPERAPKYVRARLYTYHFTAEFRTKDWWTRELKQVRWRKNMTLIFWMRNRGWASDAWLLMYRLTHQVVPNLLLTLKHKFHFGLARPGQARLKMELLFWIQQEVRNYLMCHPVPI